MHRSLAILWAWMERVQSGGAQEYCKGALKPINNSQCNIEAVTMSGVVFFVLPFFFSPHVKSLKLPRSSGKISWKQTLICKGERETNQLNKL